MTIETGKATAAERAREMVDRGFTPIPLHRVGPDGMTCSCSRGRACPSPGKHPMDDAWADGPGGIEAVEAAAERLRNEPNIGILVDRYREDRDGQVYQLIVIDIDPRNGGDEEIRSQTKLKGRPFPPTRVVATGSKGWHAYFLVPEGTRVRGRWGRGIDVKFNGQVVVEGARSSGGPYVLHSDHPIAIMPQWLLDEIERKDDPALSTTDVPEPNVWLDASDPDLPRRKAYADAALRGIYADVEALSEAKTERMEDYRGEPWDQTLFNKATKAHEWANTPEALVSHDEIDAELFKRAPRDAGFDDARVKQKLESARRTAGDKRQEIPDADPFGGAAHGGGPALDGSNSGALARQSAWATHSSQSRTFQDADVADTFAETFEGEALHVEGLGWHRWDGKKMAPVPDAVIEDMGAKMAQDMAASAIRTNDQKIVKEAMKRMQASAIRASVNLAKGQDGMRAVATDLDADKHLVNTPDGIVDTRDGTLMPHSADRRMTKMTSASFRLDANHPDLEKALGALREDARDYMQVRLGQSLLGETPSDDKLVVLHGGGSNGKSALMDALMEAVGEYGAMLSERVIVAVEGAHPTEMTDLLGARMAFLEELPSVGTLSAKRIKNLVGTDVITARRVHQNSISWKATHTVFITANHRPKVVETDHGVWRRLMLVDFPYRYVQHESELENPNDRLGDVGLRDRLKEPAQQEAVLAWLVRGAMRYQQAGRKMPEIPESIKRDTEAWRGASDHLGRFLSEHVEPAPNHCIAGSDMMRVFIEWMLENGHSRWSDQLFSERMGMSDMAVKAGTEKKRVRITHGSHESRAKISYPPGPVFHQHAEGQQIKGWTHLRWKDEGDSTARSGLHLAASAE